MVEGMAYDAMTEMLAQALYSANLGGSPRQIEATKWMHDVRIGDLVIEVTTRGRRDKDGIRMGVLVREFDLPILDENGEEYANEHYWQIDVGGRFIDWHNARFVRIPATGHQRALMEGMASQCEVAKCDDCARVDWSKQLWGTREMRQKWEADFKAGRR